MHSKEEVLAVLRRRERGMGVALEGGLSSRREPARTAAKWSAGALPHKALPGRALPAAGRMGATEPQEWRPPGPEETGALTSLPAGCCPASP